MARAPARAMVDDAHGEPQTAASAPISMLFRQRVFPCARANGHPDLLTFRIPRPNHGDLSYEQCGDDIRQPTITISAMDSSNQGDAANATTLSPYNPTPPNMKIPLGIRSPKNAIMIALPSAPTPIAVRSSPCPVAPTSRMSRANTGKRVVKGTMNKDAKITMRRLVRTVLFCQLNFHPSMMLRPREVL